MKKTRIDHIGSLCIKNEIELSWPIQQGMIYDKV